MGWGSFSSNLRNELMLSSNIFTIAPNPWAARAANSAAVPEPKITNSVGDIPVILPSKTPFPLRDLLMYSLNRMIEILPEIWLIRSTTGLLPSSFSRYSYAILVTFFWSSLAIEPAQWALIWRFEIRAWWPFSWSISTSSNGETRRIISHSKISWRFSITKAPASRYSSSV